MKQVAPKSQVILLEDANKDKLLLFCFFPVYLNYFGIEQQCSLGVSFLWLQTCAVI